MCASALVAMLCLTACEHVVFDEAEEDEGTGANVTIRATIYHIVPFDDTRATQNIADYCTRLCFVVYQDGEQKRKILQKDGDDGYGQISVRLEAGIYQLLVLGHSSESNPTLTNPESIKFSNSTGYSDTFYYYGDLTVEEGSETHTLTLQRATSMVRITITDEIPPEASQLRLYYTGESGVFDAVSGWGGTTNSKRSVNYDVTKRTPPTVLCAYTFLRDELGTLNIQLTAHNANGDVLAEKILDDVPLKNRMVTEYAGPLFSASTNEAGYSFVAETEWEVFGSYSF